MSMQLLLRSARQLNRLARESSEELHGYATRLRNPYVPNQPFWNSTLFDRETTAEPYAFGSECCRAEHFLMPLFAYWCGRMGWRPRFHRKLWELVYIVHSLHERGYLKEGARGLAFAVGQEPLPDLFSSYGVKIVATDLDLDEGTKKGWAATDQLALGKQSLFRGLSTAEQFERNVSFRNVDMNTIPDDLRDFDFCWSTCSLEHLGSIRHGGDFLVESLKTLRPGGLSIHTTEFNVSSDTTTVDNRGTVIFRKRDIKDIASRLRREGHIVAPLNFYAGSHALDRYVDVPPYMDDKHLRLLLSKYTATSIGMIIQKATD